MKEIWMKPTSVSPACRFTIRYASARRLESDCGMWVKNYEAGAVLPVVPGSSKPEGECCRYCSTGTKVPGHGGLARTPTGPKKGRSWNPRRSPMEPYSRSY